MGLLHIKRGTNGNKVNDGEAEKETQVCYKAQESLSSVWKAEGILEKIRHV